MMRRQSRKWFNAIRAVTPLVVACIVTTTMASTAWAAKPGGGGGSSSPPSGVDVSYPQCGSALPSSPAFAIVGVNGGLANNLNPCFGPSGSYPNYTQSELYWAASSATGTTSQPKVELYVNTADPGNEYNGTPIADWPTSSLLSDPFGICQTTTIGTTIVGDNSPACAWQYGYNMATQDMQWLVNAANAINTQLNATFIASDTTRYTWWLDVETANSWQSGASGQLMNAADLLGMDNAINSAPAATPVGIYSTSSQWSSITGGQSTLNLPDWIPGARTESGAISNCSLTTFSGGPVAITQWTSHSLDGDYSCP
jgi:hypothetical protein